MIYVRHANSPDRPRVFDPLSPEHPLVVEPVLCPACEEFFKAGDRTVLVALGPGKDAEAQEKARTGRFYSAVALAVHADCAGVSYSTIVPVAPVSP